MNFHAASSSNDPVLILAPTGRDATLAVRSLAESGIPTEICADLDLLCSKLGGNAGAALIASEALTPKSISSLLETLARQPPWSDLPLIILTGGGITNSNPERQHAILNVLGNATLLERPLRVATLIHAAQAALTARRRQYEVRAHLEEHLRLEKQLQAEHQKQRAFLRDILASVTEGKLFLLDSPDLLPFPFDLLEEGIPLSLTAGLWNLRARTVEAARRAGHSEERQHDLVTAASEAGMNAITHGGGQGTAWVSLSKSGTVQVRVEDQGLGISVENLPRAALARGFSTKATLGHGLKMILETIDRLYLLTGPKGTTVVIEQEIAVPAPIWLAEDAP